MILENPIVSFGSSSEPQPYDAAAQAFVKLYFSLEITLVTSQRKVGLAAA